MNTNSTLWDYIIKNAIELAYYCKEDVNVKKVFIKIDIFHGEVTIKAICVVLPNEETKELIYDIGENIIANFSEIGSAKYNFCTMELEVPEDWILIYNRLIK